MTGTYCPRSSRVWRGSANEVAERYRLTSRQISKPTREVDLDKVQWHGQSKRDTIMMTRKHNSKQLTSNETAEATGKSHLPYQQVIISSSNTAQNQLRLSSTRHSCPKVQFSMRGRTRAASRLGHARRTLAIGSRLQQSGTKDIKLPAHLCSE